jgi:hypothetical protein
MPKKTRSKLAKLAFRFVLIIGIVNLFADLTYEARAVLPAHFLVRLELALRPSE